MKVCISSTGPSEDSQSSPVFGRCQYFAVFDEKGEFTVVENKGWQSFRGAGIMAAQQMADLRCKAVVTQNLGPNAFGALQAAGVKIFMTEMGKSVREIFEDYKSKKLEEMKRPRGGFGMGRGWGDGGGRGRWQR